MRKPLQKTPVRAAVFAAVLAAVFAAVFAAPAAFTPPRAVPAAKIARALSESERIAYARIVRRPAPAPPPYLYEDTDADNPRVCFMLPEGWYVLLKDTTSLPDFYAVEYDGITGYINAGDAEIISYVPKFKFPSGQTLKIENNLSDAPLRARPDVLSEKLADIPLGSADVKFYNVYDPSNDWYCAQYGDKRGYVNAAFAVVTSAIPQPSTEAEAPPDDGTEKEPGSSPAPLDQGRLLLLIAATGVPAIAVVYLIFKPRRKPRETLPDIVRDGERPAR